MHYNNMKLSIKSVVLLALMLLSAVLGAALRPTISLADERPAIDIETMVPTAFDNWQEQFHSANQIVDPVQKEQIDKIYSQTLSRTYINHQGYRIMLSIAYGKNQSDSFQLHKPEVCYPAQGFALAKVKTGSLIIQGRTIPITRIVTRLGQRTEPLTYWTTVGDHVVLGSIEKKLAEIGYSFSGRIPDGLLFRVSSIDPDESRAFEYHEAFAKAIILATVPGDRNRLVGKVH